VNNSLIVNVERFYAGHSKALFQLEIDDALSRGALIVFAETGKNYLHNTPHFSVWINATLAKPTRKSEELMFWEVFSERPEVTGVIPFTPHESALVLEAFDLIPPEGTNPQDWDKWLRDFITETLDEYEIKPVQQ
jgi:hypothetical protein